jgi:hypothetical protein
MGKIAPPRNPTVLAETIIDVVKCSADLVRPRDEIEQTFAIDATVDAYVRLYGGEKSAG